MQPRIGLEMDRCNLRFNLTLTCPWRSHGDTANKQYVADMGAFVTRIGKILLVAMLGLTCRVISNMLLIGAIKGGK
jgi:hypothetical protein